MLRLGYESDVWSVGCVAIQMVTGQPPWPGFTNPVKLYHHIKIFEGPPPIDPKHGNDAAFAAMVARCFHKSAYERPTAQELHDDPFFQHRQTIDDDHTSVIASILASPGRDISFHWEHLLSPATPQSGKSGTGRRYRHRRSSSAGYLKSPLLLSPPIPENGVLKMTPARFRTSSPAGASPSYESNDWPSWARKALTCNSTQRHDTSRSSNEMGNESPSIDAISEILGSLAVSEDSSAPDKCLQRKNLFSESKPSVSIGEVSDHSTLQGEGLLETVPCSLNELHE